MRRESGVSFLAVLFALAQRGISHCGVFLSPMDTSNILQAKMTVESVLKTWPETWVVFKNQKTDCIGCLMQRFCTLQEVAEIYQIPLQDLIGELEACVNPLKNPQRSFK